MCEGGGNCLKYLKREWNRAEEMGHKDIKKGVQAGTPLRNMVDINGHCFLVVFFFGKYKSKNTLKDKKS